jgi:nicotinamidase-related amidase
MNTRDTALILIGFQNDYFANDGILKDFIDESAQETQALANSLSLVERAAKTDLMMIQTPILFRDDYSELGNPVGILRAIKEVGAFKRSGPGGAVIDAFQTYGERIQTVPGKHGLNAFSNTELETTLRNRGITNIVLAGAVTSICIDSTGRSAHEKGFNVYVLNDCTCGRTQMEQDFYCEQVLPLYAEVLSSEDVLGSLSVD